VARTAQRELPEAAKGDHNVTAETALAVEVKRLLAGGQREEAAERFGAIVEQQQRRAARIAYYHLRDPAEVDDVVQEAFLRAFRYLPSFRDAQFFVLWFTRILVNACFDRLRAKRRRARWLVPSDASESLAAEGPPGSESSPEATLLAKERWANLKAAIGRLPARQRTAVILIHLEGRSAREVSVVMGLSESTVRVHLFRAARKLRRLLDRDGRTARGRTAHGRTSRHGA